MPLLRTEKGAHTRGAPFSANRLSRIEGQIRGLRNMIDNDAYCIDVLTQACAAKSALEAFMREMIASHMKTCVAHDLREGDDSSIDELVNILKKI